MDCPNLLIRSFCINRTRGCCAGCAEEGKYKKLEPEALREYEFFELPPFSDLLEISSHAKLAVLYLSLHYIQSAMTRNV